MLNALKVGLKDFPTTVLVTVTGCCLALYSCVMFWVAVWREWRMEEVTLGIWLGFVAALCGVAYMWFSKKRETYKDAPRNGKDAEDTPSKTAPVIPAPMDQGET